MRHLRLLAALLATSTALPPGRAAAAEAPPSLVAAPAEEGVEELPPPPIEPPLESESESESESEVDPKLELETADPVPEETRNPAAPAAVTAGAARSERAVGPLVAIGLGVVALAAGGVLYGGAWVASMEPVRYADASDGETQAGLGVGLITVGVIGVVVGCFLPEDE